LVTSNSYVMIWPTVVYVLKAVMDLTRVSAGDCVAVAVSVSVGEVVPLVEEAEAIFTTLPLSMSVCVTVWLAVQVIEAPGAKPPEVSGQLSSVDWSSATTILKSVVLPELVTSNSYVMIWPTVVYVLKAVIDLTRVSAGDCVAVAVSVSVGLVVPFCELADAIFVTEPLSISVCVTVWDAVQVTDAPGARPPEVSGQLSSVDWSSATTIL